MPTLTFPARPDGLTFPVMLGLNGEAITDLLAAKLPIPAPITCRGVVDCGTTVTNVAPWVLHQLGLTKGMPATTQTAAGVAPTSLHCVSISLLDLNGSPAFTLPSVIVAELPIPLKNIEVLLGLNALLECDFLLEGPARRFSFIF